MEKRLKRLEKKDYLETIESFKNFLPENPNGMILLSEKSICINGKGSMLVVLAIQLLGSLMKKGLINDNDMDFVFHEAKEWRDKYSDMCSRPFKSASESSKEPHDSSDGNLDKALDILKDFCAKLDEILPAIDKDKE